MCLQLPITCSLLGPAFLLNILFSDPPSRSVLPLGSLTKFRTHTKQRVNLYGCVSVLSFKIADIQTYSRHTDIQQAYRHTAGIQTYNRHTDIQQAYRHTAGIQTYSRHTDIQTHSRHTDTQQTYRHTADIETYSRHTDIQQAYRHTAGIQTYSRHTDIQQTYRHTAGIQRYCGHTDIHQTYTYKWNLLSSSSGALISHFYFQIFELRNIFERFYKFLIL